jgi:hypothetical protein
MVSARDALSMQAKLNSASRPPPPQSGTASGHARFCRRSARGSSNWLCFSNMSQFASLSHNSFLMQPLAFARPCHERPRFARSPLSLPRSASRDLGLFRTAVPAGSRGPVPAGGDPVGPPRLAAYHTIMSLSQSHIDRRAGRRGIASFPAKGLGQRREAPPGCPLNRPLQPHGRTAGERLTSRLLTPRNTPV